MSEQLPTLVVAAADAGEVEAKLQGRCTKVTLEQLAEINERFSRAVVFLPPDPALLPGVRRALFVNPGLHFVMVHRQPVAPATVMEFVHGGVNESISLQEPASRFAELLERFADGSATGRFEYFQQLIRKFRDLGIITNSLEMAEVFAMVEKVAHSNSTVLIYGESGTGKELIARSIHALSARRGHNFIGVNTGAIPETMLEDELFGHVKGSFTSAVKDRKGKFEYANHGTIFLDEISNMPPALQVKLLRVLQERELERIGDNQSIRVDVRILSATNRRLEELVQRGEFREDLYYRLNVIPITLPPLRRRKADIPLLASFFLARYTALNGGEPKSFTLPALRLLQAYSWPGNVRQLENLVERMMVLHGDKPVLQPHDLPVEIRQEEAPPPVGSASAVQEIPDEGISLTDIMQNMERALILKSLEKSSWNKQKAARLLGIKRTTLIEKIKKYQNLIII